MKKKSLMLIVILLMGISFAGCNSDTGKSGTVCGGSVAIAGILVWTGVVDAPFVLNALPQCIGFAYDLFTFSPSNSSPLADEVLGAFNSNVSMGSTVKVTLSDKYTYSSTISGQVYSTVLANCNPPQFDPTLVYQIPYNLSVYSTMAIGGKNDLKIFTSQTSEISDFGAVNRTLFSQYGLTTTLQQTSSVDISVPAHKKATFSLSATVSYRYGVARIDDNGTTSYQPWLLTTSSKPIPKARSEIQSC